MATRFRIARSPRRKPPFAVTLTCLIFALAALSLPAWADDKLEVQPSTISTSPGYSSVKALVILRTEKPATNPSLSWLSNDVPGVELVRLGQERNNTTGHTFIWSAKIDFLPRVRVPATVVFHAEYTTSEGPKHALSTLALQTQADAAGKTVEASIEGNFDAVSEQRPGYGHLVVTNNLEVPVRVHVETDVPLGVFERPILSDFDVPARSSNQQAFELKVHQRTTPGAYAIVFMLQATWQRAGHEEERDLTISKTATAGIFFESEILKALGVPSFLVLPGCLMLFTMQLMLTLGVFGVKNDSRLPQLTVTSPGFWILAISLSGIFALIYIPVAGTNYLLHYGAEDLRNVWLWSIAIGIVVYCLYALLTSYRRRRHVYSAKDGPIEALTKMDHNKVAIVTNRVKFKIASVEFTGHVIEKIEDGMTQLWIAPKIAVDWADTQEARDAQKIFQIAIDNPQSSPLEIAEILKTAKTGGEAKTVEWSKSRVGIPALYHLKIDGITDYPAPEKIFEVG